MEHPGAVHSTLYNASCFCNRRSYRFRFSRFIIIFPYTAPILMEEALRTPSTSVSRVYMPAVSITGDGARTQNA